MKHEEILSKIVRILESQDLRLGILEEKVQKLTGEPADVTPENAREPGPFREMFPEFFPEEE